ncbi:hypothetical protein UA08_06208 [Talaromyces atroroseus]|uniref:ER transporter 6TM N-terminal domain-containing protein n=1 Tax=Talaromyces atroroseus TaxID=1441469 RepID=A0A225AMS1_TALAT|nr:hypothetical protein UA08_06208 [Talaromyces atroroseus]OKL58568.1 hypothetical protein UA08_06208 [Talaromyces atroroseus]
MPSWLNVNPRALKTLFRCWLPAWIGFLLMVIYPTLHTIGLATFFTVLAQFMCPPNGIEMIFVFTALSLWLGMFLAWGWGCIVMKAALAARPAAETQAQLMHLEQVAQQRANQTGVSASIEAEILVFDGYMLDARVSAVFLALGLLFIYVLALIRMKNPKFTFTQLFGIIITDLFMTYGPLMPSFKGTLPKVIIIPASIGLGLAFVSSLFLFPQSTSHITLEMMEKIVDGLKVPLKAIIEDYPDSESAEQQDLAVLNGAKQSLLGQWQALQPTLGFLKLDFSVGRWSDKDIVSLDEKLRGAFISTVNVLNLRLFRLRNTLQARKALATMPSDSAAPPGSSASDPSSFEQESEVEENKQDAAAEAAGENLLKEKAKLQKNNKKVGLHQINEFTTFLKAITDTDSLEVQAETIDMLRRDGTDVIQLCLEALDSVKDCIHDVNTTRLFSRLPKETFDKHAEQSQAVLEKLRAARASFIKKTTDDLLEANAELFDANGKVKTLDAHLRNRFRAVIFGMVFEEHVLSAVDGIIPLLEKASSLYKERTKNRIWFPAGIRHTASWIFKRSAKAPVHAETSFEDPDKEIVDQSDLLQEKLRIVRGTRKRQRSKLARIISGFYHFLVSPDSLYALRLVVLSLALAIPAVLPQTAGFYYKQRGLWALIMGQTTMLAYMADFTYSVLGRVIGSVIGGVLGLVAWYIGSGSGEGNSYGLAAIVGVLLIPLLCARLFLPRAFLLPSMMCAATFLLVVGYGFDYGHVASYGLPGYGYQIFWRRLLLVLIGIAASIIVQIVPRPVSATRHLCRALSKGIRTLCDHYALLLSSLGEPNTPGLEAVVGQISIQLSQSLGALDPLIALVRFEFSTSLFDSASLGQIKKLCVQINYSLARLLYITSSLSVEYQELLSRQVGMRNHHSIGDVMAVLGVIEQTLKTGDALPEVLPTPLVTRHFAHWSMPNVDLIMSKEKVQDAEYRRFCAALSAYLLFLGGVDDLVLAMKETLGEAHVVSRELLHQI